MNAWKEKKGGEKSMEKKYMERLIGKYCKIVTKEPGEDRANVVTGILEDVDYKDGFILVDSKQGLGCLRINTIIAIKPGKRRPEHQIKKDEEAVIGIGTLIVFIAMVLVAAVAASVIMQTAENLQNRAYAVGKQTIQDVSSGIRVIGITGKTDVAKTKIELIAIAIKPRAGSYDIDLNETLVYMQYDNLTVLSLDITQVSNNVSQDGIFNTLDTASLSSTEFGVIAIRDGDNSIVNSYGISSNDQAMLIINITGVLPDTGGLLAGEDIEGRLVPEVGSAGIFVIDAPNAFRYRIVEL